MDVTQQIIPKIRLTIKNLEDNKENPFFEWKLDNGSLNADIVNVEIDAFFELLITFHYFEHTLNISESNEFVQELEKNKENILDQFFSDVKMSLLNDALVNLTNFFSNKKEMNLNHNPEIVKELFFDFKTFEEKAIQCMYEFNFQETEALLEVVHMNRTNINLKVPKIIFPWYIYALTNTYKRLPKYSSNKEINIVQERYIPLKQIRSRNAKEMELLDKSQRDFKSFIKSLKVNTIYNRSLNLYLFNETTNLYDIFNLVNNKKEALENENYKTLFSVYLKSGEWYEIMDADFSEVSRMAKINSFGVKTLLINEFESKKLFINEEIWDIYNQIFKLCKSNLLNKIQENFLLTFKHIPEKIRINYAIYRFLSKEEPFEDIIENVLEGELNVYAPSVDNNLENYLYNTYADAYKKFYESKNKN